MINPRPIALVADIGGTHARFALANLETLEIQNFKKLKVSDYKSLEAATASYLATLPFRPLIAGFAVAGPVGGERISLTNSSWSFTREAMRAVTATDHITFVNDYEALAYALPALSENDCRGIGGELPQNGRQRRSLGRGPDSVLRGWLGPGPDGARFRGRGAIPLSQQRMLKNL